MPDRLVTGIAQSSDPSELEETLCKKVDCSRVSVITRDARTAGHDDSLLNFMHVGQEHTTTDTVHDVITGGTGIMTNFSGPEIPNISADTRYVGFFAEPHIIDYLKDVPIPEDQVQNYNDAIEAGRSVVTHPVEAHEAAEVEQKFKDAGLRNVKTFSGTDTTANR